MLNNNKKQETQFFGTKCGNANSIAAGYATETTNYGEIATGILNKSTKGNNPNSPEGVVGDPKATLFSVGCGTKEERKNALEVKGDGSVIISGKDGSDVNIADLAEKLKEPSVDLSGYVTSDEIYQCIKKEYDSSKRGANSIAIDDTAKAPKKNSIAIGNNAQATQLYSIAVGDNAKVTQPDSIAFGNSSQVTNSSSVALGTSSQVTGQYSTALGRNSKATNHYSIALGFSAQATGYTATALGTNAKATSDNAIAIGNNFENNKSIFSVGFNRVNGIEMDKDNYGLYLKGFGGYTGTNLTVTNNNVETLNPNIKSVQEIINDKADITPIIASTDAAITLQPNKKYEITAGDTLVLTLAEPSDKTTKNEYLCSINIGASVPTITFPKEIIWDVEPVISANKHYEINVQYSQGKYWGTIRAWEFPNDEVVLDETEQYVKPVLFAKNSNVTLKRALKTGQENSLCLPFAMTQEQISEIWGSNTEIKCLSKSDSTKIYFTDITDIEAGLPCLIKPERVNTNNVYNIYNIPASSWYNKDTTPEYIGENIKSVGFFSPSIVKAGSYVFSGGKLYHLTSDMNSKGFRIYFEDLV